MATKKPLDLSKLADSALKVNPEATEPAKEPEIISPEVEEQKFQHYKSSRLSMRMITIKGKKIQFTGHQFITTDKDIIEYIDSEIRLGLNVVTKGPLLTSAESDPMEQLRKKHIKEYLEQQAKEASDKALGITRDMGNTKSKEMIAAGPSPMSTEGVAAGSSTSGS